MQAKNTPNPQTMTQPATYSNIAKVTLDRIAFSQEKARAPVKAPSEQPKLLSLDVVDMTTMSKLEAKHAHAALPVPRQGLKAKLGARDQPLQLTARTHGSIAILQSPQTQSVLAFLNPQAQCRHNKQFARQVSS